MGSAHLDARRWTGRRLRRGGRRGAGHPGTHAGTGSLYDVTDVALSKLLRSAEWGGGGGAAKYFNDKKCTF